MPLYRSRRHKLIAGVCGGIAERVDANPTLVRIAYVVLSVVTGCGPGTVTYLILWIVLPKKPD